MVVLALNELWVKSRLCLIKKAVKTQEHDSFHSKVKSWNKENDDGLMWETGSSKKWSDIIEL